MKFLTTLIRLAIYSNLFVSLCVACYTHLAYILFELPLDNAPVIITMVFAFTYLTYNGQRLFRLKRKVKSYINIGGRLLWVLKHQKVLVYSSIFTGGLGALCLFYIHPSSWLLLIPMGALSLFYVAPIPLLKMGLREIAHLKVFIIALVWSLIIIALPLLDSTGTLNLNLNFFLAFGQCFVFIVAITLPFDIRDIKFDQASRLKTIPQAIGVVNTILLSELLVVCSWIIYIIQIRNIAHIVGISIAHLVIMIILAFASEKRNEMYFAGWVESTVIWLYVFVIGTDFLFSL